MSDLAPLVAATIRDQVVLDQQAEIESLKKQLQEEKLKHQQSRLVSNDTTKFVQLANSDGTVLLEQQVHRTPATYQSLHLFDNYDDYCSTVSEFLSCKLQLDGGHPVLLHMNQATWTRVQHHYCCITNDHYGVFAIDDSSANMAGAGNPNDPDEMANNGGNYDYDDGFSANIQLQAYIGPLSAQEYASLSDDNRWDNDPAINVQRLLQLFPNKSIKVPFDNASIVATAIFGEDEGDDDGFEPGENMAF